MKKTTFALMIILSSQVFAELPATGKYVGVDKNGEDCSLEIKSHPTINDAFYARAYFKAEMSPGIHRFNTLLMDDSDFECGNRLRERGKTVSWRGDLTSEMPSFQQIDFHFNEREHSSLKSISVKQTSSFTSIGACVSLKLKKSVACLELKKID